LDFEEAVELAAKAHRGQRDKVGIVYLLHPLRVALAVSPPARVVAVLHDVIEDTEVTLEEFRRHGLGEYELSALTLLTKRPEDEADYAAFIQRIARADGVAGDLAREVKLADVRDNLGRMPDSDEPDWVRRRIQYERALATLAS
jgi:hypothetical protein